MLVNGCGGIGVAVLRLTANAAAEAASILEDDNDINALLCCIIRKSGCEQQQDRAG
ncbi:hypothetical protein HUB94_28580 (plasmid) [Paenibacillus cellulosilyticus]|uniref:hypothetical protein n=1 Tax=Paenibacillus cellulosilyticus TaxID=375489 RepID=UPI00157FC98F|nr:hypothetical protein [Paenibacillus cellulosilyticus]QKS48232.1 hypothetical protein HUB94_28580 [Paenibacillus cellulosilyticus]